MGNEEKRMNEKTAILNVRMLGDFSITYDGRQVSFGKNTTTKAMKLLQILIYYGEQGIAREKLLNALYVREELADAANNLRVTAHRLKKMIIDAGLPEYDYIVIKKGVYRWNAPVPTIVDARKFQELYEEAQNCADTKQKEELLKQVCNMYRGEFLPEISGDEWVLLESVQYKKLYSNALKELCDGLIEKCDYEEALLFCEPACRLYPFDEWQSIKIECFLGMKRYKEAMKEYDDTAKLFFEELGISPSERLMEQFDQMSSQLKHVKPKEIQDIKQRLKEEKGQGGAYYCSLPSFRDSYRLVTRMLELLSEELQNTIQHCLRKGDSFTKYSPSQYLVLLIGTNKENCGLIFDRIRKYFAREHRSWNKYVEFYVSSVAEVDNLDTPIQFRNDDSGWK